MIFRSKFIIQTCRISSNSVIYRNVKIILAYCGELVTVDLAKDVFVCSNKLPGLEAKTFCLSWLVLLHKLTLLSFGINATVDDDALLMAVDDSGIGVVFVVSSIPTWEIIASKLKYE